MDKDQTAPGAEFTAEERHVTRSQFIRDGIDT
jgi:hypothetical protein